MRILGIETSCDETSASVVEDGTNVLSNVIASSKNDFAAMGGVIPEYAARKQLECILPVITQALDNANMTPSDLDAVAVTYGPGLLGSLLVGTTTMRVLSSIWHKPLLGVHHHQGHLDSVWLDLSATETIVFPVLTLSVSGGHTEIWYRESHTRQTQIGMTKDDAAGEAFDKGALQLSLPYPGGPELAKLAESGHEQAFSFPSPLAHDDGLDFSFSGLKTSLKYLLRDLGENTSKEKRADIAASYQLAICSHLTDRIGRAIERHPDVQEVHLVGGVSANTRLRSLMHERIDRTIRWPNRLAYCTDNGAMIAAAAYFTREEVAQKEWRTSASVKLHQN